MNLFIAEESDDKLLKKIEGREKRVEKRHAQQSHLEPQKQRKRKKRAKRIKPGMTNPKAQPHTKNKISRARGNSKEIYHGRVKKIATGKIGTAISEPTQHKAAIHVPENQAQSWRGIK